MINGKYLPRPGDVIRARVQTNPLHFSNKDSLVSQSNYQVIMYLCNIKFNQYPFINVYGKEWCNQITVCLSAMLISIAETISDAPLFSCSDESPDNPPLKDDSMESLKFSKSNRRMSNRRMREKQVDPVPFKFVYKHISLDEFKGNIFKHAEKLIQEVLAVITVEVENLKSKDNFYKMFYYFIIYS